MVMRVFRQYYISPTTYTYTEDDTFKIAPTAYFDQVSILHTTTTVNDYDSLLITYTPSLSVAAGNTTTETLMIL